MKFLLKSILQIESKKKTMILSTISLMRLKAMKISSEKDSREFTLYNFHRKIRRTKKFLKQSYLSS